MRTHTATITERGQVTIPAAVRRLLGVGPRDKVVFQVDEADHVHLAPATFTLESAFGSVTPLATPEDFDSIAAQAKEEKAARTRRELAGQ